MSVYVCALETCTIKFHFCLSLKTELQLYTSLVVSIFLYGSETWTLRKLDSEKIQAFRVTSQRQIWGIKWSDHVKNTAVSEKIGFNGLSLITADRRHSLFDHICGLSSEAPVHQALQLCIDASSGILPSPDWRRPPGDHVEHDSSKWRRI